MSELFQEVPDTIDEETRTALYDSDASDGAKAVLSDAIGEFQRAKLAVVGEHIQANTDPRRCVVEHVHPRGNGPSLSVIAEDDDQEAVIRGIIEELPDVDVIHETGHWLNIA